MTARLELGIKRESAVQLASFLVTNGLITEDQLEQAVVSSDESNRGLVETILEFGVVSEEEIAASIGTDLQTVADSIATAAAVGVSTDLEAVSQGLGYNSFADAVAAYNAQYGTSYTEAQAKEALGQ